MALPAFLKLAAEIWRAYIIDGNPGSGAQKPVKADVRAWGLTIETALNALFSQSPMFNGVLVPSVAANVLTIAVKTAAGNDPSATDPVYVMVRSATAGAGGVSIIALTAATSLVISAGSTLGSASNVPFDIWIVGFNDAGTFRLAAYNGFAGAAGSGVSYPMPARKIASSTAGGGAADSAGVFYTGTAVTTKAFVPLGRLRWQIPLATAGNWSAAPDEVEAHKPGLRLPGEAYHGRFDGLTLSNNASDANNDIDISTGSVPDDSDRGLIALTAALTKRSDAAWAVGTGNGGMDTGSKGTSASLYLWLIERSDTGVVDALFSLNPTSPTMPANYDKRQYLGAVVIDGSGNIRAFKHKNDRFTYDVPLGDASASNPGTAAVLRSLTVPPNMVARFEYWLNNVTTAAVQVLLTETAQTDTAPTTTVFHLRSTATSQVVSGEFERKVDASSQIRARHQASGASDALVIVTIGWRDPRRLLGVL